jgi:ferritin
MYVDYAKIAREEQDELTLRMLTDFIDIQVNEVEEFTLLMSKVKAYSAVPGLFYHLDHELRKQGK